MILDEIINFKAEMKVKVLIENKIKLVKIAGWNWFQRGIMG